LFLEKPKIVKNKTTKNLKKMFLTHLRCFRCLFQRILNNKKEEKENRKRKMPLFFSDLIIIMEMRGPI
jgi:hypothetical protein